MSILRLMESADTPMRDSRGGRTSMKYVGAMGGREETRVWGVMSLLTQTGSWLLGDRC